MVSYVMVIHLMLTQEGFIQSEFVRIEFLFTRPPAQSSSLYFESVTTFLCPMGLPDCLDCPDHHQCACFCLVRAPTQHKMPPSFVGVVCCGMAPHGGGIFGFSSINKRRLMLSHTVRGIIEQYIQQYVEE